MADPVDVNTAREVAMKFANTNSKSPVRSMDEVQLAATYSIMRGEAALYIFNTSNGFVIVSVGGHTRCVPTTGISAGVYVLRLINGDNVRTQKIVVE